NASRYSFTNNRARARNPLRERGDGRDGRRDFSVPESQRRGDPVFGIIRAEVLDRAVSTTAAALFLFSGFIIRISSFHAQRDSLFRLATQNMCAHFLRPFLT